MSALLIGDLNLKPVDLRRLKSSLSSSFGLTIMNLRKHEEVKVKYHDPVRNDFHYLNVSIQYDEFLETLQSFATTSSAVGVDGISYKLLNRLPEPWK